MEFLRRFRDQFGAFWGSLNPIRRFLLVAVGLAVLIGIAVFGFLSQDHGSYVALAKDAPLDEVGAIRAKLIASSIPYRLDDSGTGISVTKDRYAEAKVGLAVDGIPTRGGKGLELMDDSQFGSTPFVQNVNYQRAIQGELARSLMQIDGVLAARVLIARPEPTPFVRDQRAPTASVVLKLRSNANLSRATSASIVSIVARAVDGLKPENVTVVDSTGRLLSDPNSADRENLPTGQLEYLRELETYLAGKAENMLNRHLGQGRAVVSVHADVNFQKLKEKSESYSTEKVVLEERTTTSSSTSAPRGGGVVGAVSNISRTAGTQASSSGGGGGNMKEEMVQTSYAVPKVTREIEDRMSAVTRITIAALVDLSPGEEGQPTAVPISVTDAQEIIKQAIGYKTGRDEIKVSNVKLGIAIAPLADDEEAIKAQRFQTYVSLVRNVSLTAATLFAFALIPLLLLRRIRKPAPAPVPEPETIDLSPAPEPTQQALLARLVELARGDPDRVANVFGILVASKARA